MDNKEKIRLAINQISINNCDGSANEDAIKAVRYLQEVSEAINYTRCCTELPNKQKSCVNGVDSDTCRYNGICDYC